jgi:hypothetical protein
MHDVHVVHRVGGRQKLEGRMTKSEERHNKQGDSCSRLRSTRPEILAAHEYIA